MRGKVKWFSDDKGYGFITQTLDDGFKDYFFHISDVVGPNAPKPGDIVSFEPRDTKKGVAAAGVEIVNSASSNPIEEQPVQRSQRSRDDRVECTSCGKRMVPRIQYKNGEPYARICPFCMKSQEKCFIATAAFGNPEHPVVCALRRYRDETLLHTDSGQTIIRIYYQVSPSIAALVERHPSLRQPTRWVLTVIANWLSRARKS